MTAVKRGRQGGSLLLLSLFLRMFSSAYSYVHYSYRRLSTIRTIPTMMPEGPEVRTLVDQLQPAVGMRLTDFRFLSGRYVRGARPRGFEAFAKTITSVVVKEATSDYSDAGNGSGGGYGNTVSITTQQDKDDNDEANDFVGVDIIKSLSCKGKFIYLILDEGNVTSKDADYQRSIWLTLGMTGRIVNEEDVNKPRASNSDKTGSDPRWFFETLDTSNGQRRKIYYRDPRNFGTLIFSLSALELENKLASLGPDLLDLDNTTEEVFIEAMNKSTQKRNICKFLMDQSRIAGVGNYILAEGLYRARIDPFASLAEINLEQRKSLFRELREVITTSYNSQGLTRPNGGTYRSVDGSRGQFEFQLQCYGQDLSPNNNPVIKEVDGPHGRAIWYVPEEQLFIPKSERSNSNNLLKKNTQSSQSATHTFEKKNVEKGVTRYSMVQSSKDTFGEAISNSLTDSTWKSVLQDHFLASESYQSMIQLIETQISNGAEVYPPVEDIFSALNMCPLDDVRVVVVGQDPYHQPNQGHGLAFSVRKGVTPPPSLRNIFKEAIADVAIDPPTHGNLEGWAKQGVLLLNTVLTVRRGEANSHAKIGWEKLTDLIINKINEEKSGVVFLLWGAPAARKASCVDEAKHTVIRTSHPSPLGATKTASPFLGSRCFSRTNEALKQSGKEPIDWNAL